MGQMSHEVPSSGPYIISPPKKATNHGGHINAKMQRRKEKDKETTQHSHAKVVNQADLLNSNAL